jgi:hypothetical protein
MHTDRRELIGLMHKLSAAGDGQRYTAGLSVGRSRKVISWAIQNLI